MYTIILFKIVHVEPSFTGVISNFIEMCQNIDDNLQSTRLDS